MSEGMFIEDHLIVFKEIVADLETLETKYDEEDFGLILLLSLLSSYINFRENILQGKELENTGEASVIGDEQSEGELLMIFDDFEGRFQTL